MSRPVRKGSIAQARFLKYYLKGSACVPRCASAFEAPVQQQDDGSRIAPQGRILSPSSRPGAVGTLCRWCPRAPWHAFDEMGWGMVRVAPQKVTNWDITFKSTRTYNSNTSNKTWSPKHLRKVCKIGPIPCVWHLEFRLIAGLRFE